MQVGDRRAVRDRMTGELHVTRVRGRFGCQLRYPGGWLLEEEGREGLVEEDVDRCKIS